MERKTFRQWYEESKDYAPDLVESKVVIYVYSGEKRVASTTSYCIEMMPFFGELYLRLFECGNGEFIIHLGDEENP